MTGRAEQIAGESAGQGGRTGDRYRLLDAWRGVACLMVVLHHAGFAVMFDAPGGDGRRVETRARGRRVPLADEPGRPALLRHQRLLHRGERRVGPPPRRGGGAVPRPAGLADLSPVLGGPARLRRRHRRASTPSASVGSTTTAAGTPSSSTRPGKLDRTQWVGNITLTEGYRPTFWRPPDSAIYTRVAWSLCYEEQFYFVCFLALLAERGPLRSSWP